MLEHATEIEERQCAHVFTQGSEEQKMDWSAWIEGRSNATLAFHAQYAAEDARARRVAMTTLLRARSRILEAVADSLVRLRHRGELHDLVLLQHWTSLLAEESDWYAAKRGQEPPERMKLFRDPDFDRIRVAREEAEREIARRIAGVHIPSVPRVALGPVQAVLLAETVLVEFSRFEP